jgi:(p)ppGpp synthase/HD superfamily hydrolase
MNAAVEAEFAPRQTITELLIQLHENGHDSPDLARVRDAYRVACQMFASNYRANEKPFICHLVGTASAVARYSRRVDLIPAGLLHAAYDLGLFPDGKWGGASQTHQSWLISKVGKEVSDLALRYERFKFLPAQVERLAVTYSADDDKDIVLVRLCNEIDDLSGGGLAFATKHGERIGPHAENCAKLSSAIGMPEVGDTILKLGAVSDSMDWARAMSSERPQGYRVVPNLRAYLSLRTAALRGKRVKLI